MEEYEQINWENLRKELLYPKQNLASLQAIYAGLAFYAKMPKQKPEYSQNTEYPQSDNFALDQYGFLKKLFETNENELIYEWLSIISKQGKTIPVNLLPDALDYMAKHKAKAYKWINSIGQEGKWIAQFKAEWHFLQSQHWEDLLQSGRWPDVYFAFKVQSLYNSEQTYKLLDDNMGLLKDAEIQRLILQLPLAKEMDYALLAQWYPNQKPSTQLTISQKYLESRSSENENIAEEFWHFAKNKKIEEWPLPFASAKKEKNPLIRKLLSIPPSWADHENADLIFDLLFEHQLCEKWAAMYHTNHQSKSALNFGKYLIRKKILNEHFPIQLFSQYLKFEDFNTLVCYWIKHEGEQTDVEALFQMALYEKHYWDNETLESLLSLRKHKAIIKKYDLDVFWKLFPYKLNPYTIDIKMIEKVIGYTPETNIPFNDIVRFRLWMRRK